MKIITGWSIFALSFLSLITTIVLIYFGEFQGKDLEVVAAMVALSLGVSASVKILFDEARDADKKS